MRDPFPASGVITKPTQAEAEAGVSIAERMWTAQRVKQAIKALETWELIGTATASASATIDFTWAGVVYRKVVLVTNNALPVDNDVEAQIRVSTDGGATYITSGTYNFTTIARENTADDTAGAAGSTRFILSAQTATDAVGNDTGEGFWGVIEMLFPAIASATSLTWRGGYESSTGVWYTVLGAGRQLSVQDLDGIRFFFVTGNISVGDFACYGLR